MPEGHTYNMEQFQPQNHINWDTFWGILFRSMSLYYVPIDSDKLEQRVS